MLLHCHTPGIKCSPAKTCIKTVCEPWMPQVSVWCPEWPNVWHLAGFSEFRRALTRKCPLGWLHIFLLIMCVILVRFTQLFTCMLKCSKEISIKSFQFLETVKELEKKHEGFAWHYAQLREAALAVRISEWFLFRTTWQGERQNWSKKKARQLFVWNFSLSLLAVGLLVPLLKLIAKLEWFEWQKTLNKSTCLISFYLCDLSKESEVEECPGLFSSYLPTLPSCAGNVQEACNVTEALPSSL